MSTQTRTTTKKPVFKSGSLSERMKQNRPAESAAPATKSSTKSRYEYVENPDDFPVLAEVRSKPDIGKWAAGIDTIIAARYLPDPAIAERAQKNMQRNMQRIIQTYEESDEEYDYMDYSDSEENYPVPVSSAINIRTVIRPADDVDWKEI